MRVASRSEIPLLLLLQIASARIRCASSPRDYLLWKFHFLAMSFPKTIKTHNIFIINMLL